MRCPPTPRPVNVFRCSFARLWTSMKSRKKIFGWRKKVSGVVLDGDSPKQITKFVADVRSNTPTANRRAADSRRQQSLAQPARKHHVCNRRFWSKRPISIERWWRWGRSQVFPSFVLHHRSRSDDSFGIQRHGSVVCQGSERVERPVVQGQGSWCRPVAWRR